MIKLVYPKFWQTRNIIAYLLLPLSLLYLLASYIRRITACPVLFPCKVICVGNVTIGGTGKTQIVIFLAQLFKTLNIDFIIITKAYGSKLKRALLVEEHHTAIDVGDESIMLLKYGKVIATKKICQIIPFINKLKPRVIIVDDSMQNPNFHKDLIILSIDANRLFGNGFLIPAGPLRQYSKRAIEKADIVILLGSANINNDSDFLVSSDPFLVKLGIKANNKFFYAQIVPSININNSKTYFAFSGIGNPERFFSTLENYGVKLSGYKIFPDHHQYCLKDIKYLQEQSKKHNSFLITTSKDYVKISNTNLQVVCCDVHLSINNQKILVDLIYEKIL